MTRFEYKVIPAPSKGRKGPGIKGPEARFAHGLEEVINEMAADGWTYQRSDILPSEERQGLTSSHTVYRSVLVFYRKIGTEPEAVAQTAPAAEPEPESPPESTTEPDLLSEPAPETAPEAPAEADNETDAPTRPS